MRNQHHLKWLFGSVVLFFIIPGAIAQRTVMVPEEVVSYADLVVYNGKVVTMDDRSINPTLGKVAEAMAVRDGKILAVGSNQGIVLYAGPNTLRIDLHGRTVIPGIIDSHAHLHNGAMALYAQGHPEVLESVARQFEVAGKTYPDLKRAIEVILKENMVNTPPHQWAFISLPSGGLSGTGIGPKFIQDKQITNQELDKLAPNTPVLLKSHPAYMTNRAGQRLIADLYQADPEYNLGLDKDGYGDLIEYSRSLIVDQYFHDKIELLAQIIQDELERNAAIGITTYSSHITGLRFMDAFMKLVRENKMPLRFAYTHYFGFAGNPDPASVYRRLGDMAGLGADYFWQTGIGLSNVDSGPPMICTTMKAPEEIKKREWCRNEPGTAFEKAIYTAIRSHQRLAVGHMYGDQALDYLFQTIEKAREDDSAFTLDYIRSRHFSSDHCGFYPRPDQIPKLKEYGWIISCNGTFINRSSPWLKVYGMEYANWISPIKSLVTGGVRTVYENEESWMARDGIHPPTYQTETPTTYFSPALLLLTRKNSEGQLIAPEEAIDRVTLMKMMTVWPSEFVLKEKMLGTLEPGKWADFLVLNRDYFTVPEQEIANLYPVMTVVGGKPVFWRGDFAAEQGHSPVGPQLKYSNLPKSDPSAAR